jgi:hypothetical protein
VRVAQPSALSPQSFEIRPLSFCLLLSELTRLYARPYILTEQL